MAGQNGVVLHTGTYSQLRMDWSSTPNVANNQSSFTATIYVQVTTSGWNIGPWSDVSGSYFGTSSSHTFNGAIPNISGRYNMKTFTTTVNHASDGKGSINIVWKWGVNSSWGGVVNPSGSRTLTLDTIARASKHTLSHSSRAFGDTLTITTNRASSAFTHKLWYQYAGRNGDIATNVSTSYAWAIPKSLANGLTDGTSTPMNIVCDTYNGSTKIGSHTVQMTITVADTAEFRPVINEVLLTETVAGLPPLKEGFLQKKSRVKVDVNAAGAYSSWIKTVEIKINGETHTSNGITTNFLTQSGTQKASIKVTDSRNRTATKDVNYLVTPYDDPKITNLTAVRCTEAGVIDAEGTSVLTVFSTDISLVETSAVKHKILYRKAGTSDPYMEVTVPGDTSLTDKSVIVNNIDIDYAYEFVLSVQDYFTTTTKAVEVPTGFTLMDFASGGKGLAFGEVATGPGLSVNFVARFKKGIEAIIGRATNFLTFKRETGEELAHISENQAGDGLVIHTSGGYVAIDADGGLRTSGNWATVRRDLILDQHVNGVSNSIQTAKFTLPAGIGNVNYYDYVEVLFRHGDLGSMAPGYSIVTVWLYDTYWAASFDQSKPIDINISTGNWIGLRTQYSIPSGKHSQVIKVYGVKHCRANITLEEHKEEENVYN